jgi:hypothetical protein
VAALAAAAYVRAETGPSNGAECEPNVRHATRFGMDGLDGDTGEHLRQLPIVSKKLDGMVLNDGEGVKVFCKDGNKNRF